MSRTAVVIGASAERRKFGNKSVRAHRAAGFTVYPVTVSATEVEGLPAFASMAAVPEGHIDRVTVYLPPAVGLKVLPEIAARNPGEVWFNPGAHTPEVLAEAKRLGLNVIAACSIVDLGMWPAQFGDE